MHLHGASYMATYLWSSQATSSTAYARRPSCSWTAQLLMDGPVAHGWQKVIDIDAWSRSNPVHKRMTFVPWLGQVYGAINLRWKFMTTSMTLFGHGML